MLLYLPVISEGTAFVKLKILRQDCLETDKHQISYFLEETGRDDCTQVSKQSVVLKYIWVSSILPLQTHSIDFIDYKSRHSNKKANNGSGSFEKEFCFTRVWLRHLKSCYNRKYHKTIMWSFATLLFIIKMCAYALTLLLLLGASLSEGTNYKLCYQFYLLFRISLQIVLVKRNVQVNQTFTRRPPFIWIKNIQVIS